MRAINGDFHFHSDPITKSRHWIFEPMELYDVINYFTIDAELTSLLIQAHSTLGRLEGISKYDPHMDYSEDMIIRHEVCMSCSVYNLLITPAVMLRSDINTMGKSCAVNLFGAAKDFEIQQLSIELFCKLHEAVMKDAVWGTSGRIRTQLFLMHPYFRADMEDCNPPLPERFNDLLNALVTFSKKEGQTDVLIKAALKSVHLSTFGMVMIRILIIPKIGAFFMSGSTENKGNAKLILPPAEENQSRRLFLCRNQKSKTIVP